MHRKVYLNIKKKAKLYFKLRMFCLCERIRRYVLTQTFFDVCIFAINHPRKSVIIHARQRNFFENQIRFAIDILIDLIS